MKLNLLPIVLQMMATQSDEQWGNVTSASEMRKADLFLTRLKKDLF